jgi:hypothetical protein
MEVIGPVSLLYIMFTLPKELGLQSLPWGNWTMAGCFVGIQRQGGACASNRLRRLYTTCTAPSSRPFSSTPACPR